MKHCCALGAGAGTKTRMSRGKPSRMCGGQTPLICVMRKRWGVLIPDPPAPRPHGKELPKLSANPEPAVLPMFGWLCEGLASRNTPAVDRQVIWTLSSTGMSPFPSRQFTEGCHSDGGLLSTLIMSQCGDRLPHLNATLQRGGPWNFREDQSPRPFISSLPCKDHW